MSLTLALNNALSGLLANQTALGTVSNNIANANTEGYSRQYVEQSARVVGGIASGVQIDTIARKVDQYLEAAVQQHTTNVGYNARINEFYSRIQVLLGEPGSSNSIDQYVDNFFNALQSLAGTPDLASFRQTVVSTADALAKETSSLATSLEELRFRADQEMSEAITVINDEIMHLDDINHSITRAEATNSSKASLFDERDKVLKKLSDYLDLQMYYMEDGRVSVSTGNGISLVDDIPHELRYTQAKGIGDFVHSVSLSPITVHGINEFGHDTGVVRTLISGGVGDEVTTVLTGGGLKALKELRDQLIPSVLDQLDMLASNLRDRVNAIHNSGTGFPPPTELTGQRLVGAQDAYDWTGSIRIGALNADGTPAASTYLDESYTGYRPLLLDLATLDGGLGAGVPTIETIINEINNHFNAPPWKAEVANLNNIQIVSDNIRLPNAAVPTFSFDLDAENISNADSETWVTNVRVLDDTGANITNVSDTMPRITIDPTNTYSFTAGSNLVVINTTQDHNFAIDQWVYLEDPGGLPLTLGGGSVPNSDMVGFFKVKGIPNTRSFTIEIPTAATTTVVEGGYGTLDALPRYDEIEAGEKKRSRDNGLITATLGGPGGNATSAYYDITITVAVNANDGNRPTFADLTYRIYNRAESILNQRYDVTAVSTGAKLVFPETPQQYLRAYMVDEDGHELQRTNGTYGDQEGYLRIEGITVDGEKFGFSIDELDSKQMGSITYPPHRDGTNRGFSHFFDLNNFFKVNEPSQTGDTLKNSAISFAVSDHILNDPSRVSTGNLSLSHQRASATGQVLYTYEINKGDNTIVQRMADLALQSLTFDPAGGLPEVQLSFNGYTSQVLGNLSSVSASAETVYKDSQSLLDGFSKRADSYKGVNMDEELANTVIYQNAYAASARIISVTDQLFKALLEAF